MSDVSKDAVGQLLALAKELQRLQLIEEAARVVVGRWENGYIVGKPEYTSYCDLDMAILRDRLDPVPPATQEEEP